MKTLIVAVLVGMGSLMMITPVIVLAIQTIGRMIVELGILDLDAEKETCHVACHSAVSTSYAKE